MDSEGKISMMLEPFVSTSLKSISPGGRDLQILGTRAHGFEPYPLSAETFEPFAHFTENYYTNV